MSKKTKSIKKQPIVRAYRISDETHLQLKELAKADDRKIGSKLTQIIKDAHSAFFAPQGA